jgi:hypothetical protein
MRPVLTGLTSPLFTEMLAGITLLFHERLEADMGEAIRAMLVAVSVTSVYPALVFGNPRSFLPP